MKNIKKMIAAVTMMMVLMVGTSFGGLIVTDAQQPQQPCTANTNNTAKSGVILSDATGIIVMFITGIIVINSRETPVDCGIIVIN